LTLKQANYDLSRQQFNTVASCTMKMLNTLENVQKKAEQDWQAVAQEGFSILLRILSPIAPHIAQTLWKDLGFGDDILNANWPEPIDAAMVQDEIELMIQVNGKLRGSLKVPASTSKEEIEEQSVSDACVQKFLTDDLKVRKIIVVPNKLVNIVIG
jgi:leucyl-tRNA synthetase